MNEIMQGIDAFATIAPTYEAWFDSPLGAFVDRHEQEALARILPEGEAHAILEIGAGTGHITRWLTRYAHQVTAVEPSSAMRAEGQRRLADLISQGIIHWDDATAEKLPCPDNQFDSAVLFTTLEFVEQPATALQETRRVVRPEGWIVVGMLPALSAWAALYRHKADRGKLPWTAARFYTREDLEQWMGFPAEQSETAVYLAPGAIAPFAEADQAGRRAGNAPAMEILRWRNRS
jgi:ubiquinone/menaquinone biosynthesis C-methylase UbiE